MKKENLKAGSTITQYAIIIGLVALVLIPAFFILGGNIHGGFLSFLNGLKNQEAVIMEKIKTNVPPPSQASPTNPLAQNVNAGDLGGSPQNPVRQCVDSVCTVDYGEFSLTGIPEDMSEFLQASGTSGTTMLLNDLMEQIIQQSSTIDTDVDIKLLKKLAERGHELAALEKTIEINAESYIQNPDQLVSNDFVLYANYLENSSSRAFFDINLENINKQLENSTNPNDQNIKAIVNILADEILTLANNMSEQGQSLPTGYNLPLEDIQQLLEPDASNISNIDAAIICQTGNGEDNGVQCK
jgi:Flp pilus assembly pilin Flp